MGVVGVLIAFLMYTKGWHWTAASLAGLALALAIGLYQGWFPDGHFKFPHLWPLKFPRAGRGGLWVIGLRRC